MIHIAAISQIRLDSDGRVYYRRKPAEGKRPLEAIRCLKRRISDAIYHQLVIDAMTALPRTPTRAREGTAGRLTYPARPASTRTPTLRISHFPDPHQRRYRRPHQQERARSRDPYNPPLDVRREPM
jgi:hypothetical protein